MLTRYEPVNQWIACEILTSNSPLSLDVIKIYNQAPLVEYLDGILMNYQQGVSAKSTQQAKIDSEISLEEAIVRDYIEKTSFETDVGAEENIDCSKIKDVFETAETNKRVKSLFPILLKEGRTIEAEILLEEYTSVCSDDYYLEFAEVIMSLDMTDISATSPTIAEQLSLSSSEEGIQALVLLEELSGVADNFPGLVLPSEGNKSLERNMVVPRKAEKLLEVSPNPAQEYFYVSYVAPPNNDEKVLLRLTDISGKVIEVRPLNREIGVSFYDCSNLKNGTYIICLEVGDDVVESTKIAIQ